MVLHNTELSTFQNTKYHTGKLYGTSSLYPLQQITVALLIKTTNFNDSQERPVTRKRQSHKFITMINV